MSQQSHLIIKGSALSVTQMFLQVAVTFFLTPFVISHLGKQLYGIWILIGTFVGYYGLLDLGISGAVMRFVSRAIGADSREDINYYVSSAFFVLCGAGLLTGIISVAAFMLAGFFIDDPANLHLFQSSVLILGFSIGLSFPLRVFDGVLNAYLRVDLKRYIEIAQLVFRTGMVVIFLNMGFGIIGLAAVSAVAMLSEFLLKTFFSFRVDRSLKVKVEFFSRRTLHRMKDFSIFNFIQSIANILIHKIDPYMVAFFVNVTSVAYYGIALSLAGYFEEFFRALLGVLFPVFAQKEGARDFEGIRRIFIFISRLTIIISCFMGIMTILYARQFLECWLGPDFIASYYILIVLISPLIISLGFFPAVFVLNNLGKHRLNTYFDIAQGLLNLFLSMIFGFYYGSIGIAFGTAVPLIILGGFAKSYFACKTVRLNSFDYWGKMFFTIFVSLILIIPVWFCFGRNIDNTYYALVKILFTHCCLFSFAGYFILLPRSDMKMIKEKILLSLGR